MRLFVQFFFAKIVLNPPNVRLGERERERQDAPAAAFVKHWTGVLGSAGDKQAVHSRL